MALEIPRGWTPGRTAAIVSAAAAATPGPAQAYAPYQQLSRGIERGGSALAAFAEAAVADQALEDKVAAGAIASQVDAAARNITGAMDENQQVVVEGVQHRLSDWKDPEHPEAGTIGEQLFREQMDKVVSPLMKNLPKRQAALASLAVTQVLNTHSASLQDGMIKARGERRAYDAVDAVHKTVAEGDPAFARRQIGEYRDAGVVNELTAAKLKEYVSVETLNRSVSEFISQPRTDGELATFIATVDASEDPYITQDMKVSAIGSAYTMNERNRVAREKSLHDAQDHTEVLVMEGINKGEVAASDIFTLAKEQRISRDFVGPALTMLNDNSEGKTDPATLNTLVRSMADAQGLSESAQVRGRAQLKTKINEAFEQHLISATHYKQLQLQVADLGQGSWATPDYKEAVSRAAGLLGAQATTTDPNDPNFVANMLAAAFAGSQKIGAQLTRMKFDLDVAMRDVPADQRDPISWVAQNVSRYAEGPSTTAVSALANQIGTGASKFTDAAGKFVPGGAAALKKELEATITDDVELARRITEINEKVRQEEIAAQAAAQPKAAPRGR